MANRADLVKAIMRLDAVFPIWKDTSVETLATVWQGVLSDVPDHALERAVNSYLRSTAVRFPKPGQLREMCKGAMEQGEPSTLLEKQRRYHANGDWWTNPCPTCGALLEWLPSGRAGIRHDSHRHGAAGTPYVGGTLPLVEAIEPTAPAQQLAVLA